MNIKINGEKKTIDVTSLTISDLLKLENVKMPEMVTVELNGDIIDRATFSQTPIRAEDEVEFLYFMGGGCLKFESTPPGWGQAI